MLRSERGQAEKTTYYIMPFIWLSEKGKIIERINKLVIAMASDME